ncbi:MAG: hypothetical protein QM779_08645 [Propionicimonas sp.]|uniref:hypothetical protein n=1 Tax=Propionicimonas sp. TaxID=1955623 RepID=UPI003D0D3AEC
MKNAQVPTSELRAEARQQADLVTARQARAAGFGRDGVQRMMRDGHWERRGSGLFDLAPGHESVTKRIWATALEVEEPYAIGGDAALVLHGLERPVGRVLVWVPPDRRPRSAAEGVVRRDRLGRVERATGVPVRIRADDAVVDVGQHLAVEPLVTLLSDAVRLRITTLERLQKCVDGRKRVRHRALISDILADLSGIESTLEFVYRRDVERAHGLPEGKRQESSSDGSRSDVLYDEYALLVELDGRFGHVDAASGFRDLRRDNRHATRNEATLRYGSADVRGRACLVSRQVWEALSVRGWREPFQPCRRCPVSPQRQGR